MKKLLLGTCILIGAMFSVKAQLPYTSNFTSTTFPAGWSASATNHPGNPGFRLNNNWPNVGIGDWYNYVPTDGWAAYVDDIDNNTGKVDNYDTLYSGIFSCAAASSVFISFDLNFNNYTNDEVGTLAVSNDGGVTWHTAATFPIWSGIVTWTPYMLYDISTYAANQANVKVAFCWNNIGAITAGYPGWGMAVANVNVYQPETYDLSTVQVSNWYLGTTGAPISFLGTEYNFGTSTVTSMHLNYSVNGGPVQSDPLTSLSFGPNSSYAFAHSLAWTPSVAGTYLVKFWADNINGSNSDLNNGNDTLYSYYTIVNSPLTKVALYEEFTQASCDPCMYSCPNIWPVLKTADGGGYCNSMRYHPDWPGYDWMNSEIQNLFEGARVSYYGVDGVPYGVIDGTTPSSPSSETANNIQSVASVGSSFSITINSCTYNTTNSTFSLNASITSTDPVAEGIKARVMLSVDTIKYDSNQSDEDPTSSFKAPLGTGSTLDSYYKYVKTFPQVAEEMLPNANGTTLTPFTANQTQTLNVTWKQNHPWGLDPKKLHYTYDSLFPGEHMTVWLQDDQAAAKTTNPVPGNLSAPYPTHAQTGAITQYVYQSASAAVTRITGIEEIGTGVYFEMYPNPTNGNTTIAFSIAKSQNVTVGVYNTLGQQVYYTNQGTMTSGDHSIMINGQALNSGVYFVRFTTDNVTTTKKLVIQH